MVGEVPWVPATTDGGTKRNVRQTPSAEAQDKILVVCFTYTYSRQVVVTCPTKTYASQQWRRVGDDTGSDTRSAIQCRYTRQTTSFPELEYQLIAAKDLLIRACLVGQTVIHEIMKHNQVHLPARTIVVLLLQSFHYPWQ